MPKDKKKDTTDWYDRLIGKGMAKKAQSELKNRKKNLDKRIKDAGG